MANIPVAEAVEITEQEHTSGEVSGVNLQTAKSLFDLNRIVAWRYLWSLDDDRDLGHETMDLLGSLPTENDFIHVNARSLLPHKIVNNKVKWPWS